jgi:hypothetical protein
MSRTRANLLAVVIVFTVIALFYTTHLGAILAWLLSSS